MTAGSYMMLPKFRSIRMNLTFPVKLGTAFEFRKHVSDTSAFIISTSFTAIETYFNVNNLL